MSKRAFVFPGQGSQSVGMLAELAQVFPQVQATFEEASEALGKDLWALSQNGPEEALNQTENTQPALLAAGIAVWRAWQTAGGRAPDYLAGHSLGEYSALVAAGSLSLADGIRLVAARGRAMQEAVPAGTGSMAAILGLADEQVVAVCEQAASEGVVSAANFNSPGQVVIAGEKAAVARAVELASEAGAKRAVELAVSVPSHCALMKPAAEALRPLLEETPIQPPAIPVVHNADVSLHDDPAAIRQVLLQQLYLPVRWAESMQWLVAQGVGFMAECGPGKVLMGLGRRIDKASTPLPLENPDKLKQFAIEE